MGLFSQSLGVQGTTVDDNLDSLLVGKLHCLLDAVPCCRHPSWIRSLPVLVGVASDIGLWRIVLQLQSYCARGFEKYRLPAR